MKANNKDLILNIAAVLVGIFVAFSAIFGFALSLIFILSNIPDTNLLNTQFAYYMSSITVYAITVAGVLIGGYVAYKICVKASSKWGVWWFGIGMAVCLAIDAYNKIEMYNPIEGDIVGIIASMVFAFQSRDKLKRAIQKENEQ